MSVPLNHVAQAAKFLTSGQGTPKEKLVMGGKMLRVAMMLAGDWTPDLLEKANGILAALLEAARWKRRWHKWTRRPPASVSTNSRRT